MRRQALPSDVMDDIRWSFKVIYRRRLPPSAALEALRERAGRPMVDEYIDFIESSKRGLCRGANVSSRTQSRTQTIATAADGG
jgi:acyl-[acyl carrier protein]--UDP-N-acetylglucosamine O-acyltransferase